MILTDTTALGAQLQYSKSQANFNAATRRISSGTKILLGNEDIRERLQRSVDILFEIKNKSLGIPTLIDARYNNGAAVKWNNKLELAESSRLQRDMSL